MSNMAVPAEVIPMVELIRSYRNNLEVLGTNPSGRGYRIVTKPRVLSEVMVSLWL